MIPYPSVELLLAKHGTTGRAQARAEITAAILIEARRLAGRAGRSIRCNDGDHRRVVDGSLTGCGNDGSTCICECHDLKENG